MVLARLSQGVPEDLVTLLYKKALDPSYEPRMNFKPPSVDLLHNPLFKRLCNISEIVTTGHGSLSLPLYDKLVAIFKFLRAEVEAIRDSGLIDFTVKSVTDLIDLLLGYTELEIAKIIKYHCTFCFGKYVFNTQICKSSFVFPYLRADVIPERPAFFRGNGWLWSGKVKRSLKLRSLKFSFRHSSLFFSLLQGVKRGSHVVSLSFIAASIQKHQENMEKPDPCIDYDDSFFEDIRPILDRLGLRRFKHTFRLLEASTSAGHKAPRKIGGQRVAVQMGLESGLHSVRENSDVVRGRILPRPLEYLSNLEMDLPRLDCTAIPICEPLKVRVITAGPSEQYYLSRSLQKDLWSSLKDLSNFTLIGNPSVSYAIDNGIVSNLNASLRDLYYLEPVFWVSGDYESATDNLSMVFSSEILDYFLSKVDPFQFQNMQLAYKYCTIMKQVLGAHDVHYEVGETLGIPMVTQSNGQLMGSPLSFPILCLANFIAFVRAFDRWSGRSWKRYPVVINGDDIVFLGTPSLYKIWREEIASVGFLPSKGKNYTHSEFFIVNSEMYHSLAPQVLQSRTLIRHGHIQTWDGTCYEKVPWLNTGLLTGQSKISGRLETRTLPLCDFYNTCVSSCWDPMRAHRRFLHYHRKTLEDMTKLNGQGRPGFWNMYNSPLFGGLGFDPYAKYGLVPGSKVNNKGEVLRYEVLDVLRKEYLDSLTIYQKKFIAFVMGRYNPYFERGVYHTLKDIKKIIGKLGAVIRSDREASALHLGALHPKMRLWLFSSTDSHKFMGRDIPLEIPSELQDPFLCFMNPDDKSEVLLKQKYTHKWLIKAVHEIQFHPSVLDEIISGVFWQYFDPGKSFPDLMIKLRCVKERDSGNGVLVLRSQNGVESHLGNPYEIGILLNSSVLRSTRTIVDSIDTSESRQTTRDQDELY